MKAQAVEPTRNRARKEASSAWARAPVTAFPSRPYVLRRQACACGGDCPRCSAPPVVDAVLASPGRPLEAPSRAFMESRFSHDFSSVRIHTDAAAAASAQAVQARAYTAGHHVVFAQGQYAPATDHGRKLLAHELAHVVQGRGVGSAMPGNLRIGEPGSAEEREADHVAERLASSERVSAIRPASSAVLRRQAAAPGPPLCSENQISSLNDLGTEASFLVVEPAVEKLGEFRTGNPAENPAAGSRDAALSQALFRSFNVSGDAATEKAPLIRSKLESINRVLKSLASRTQVCPASNTFENCPGAAAYVTETTTITYCPSFFAADRDTRLYILIHEAAHAADESIIDRGYSGQRIFALLPANEAMTNAESYARLAMELFDRNRDGETRSFGSFEFAADNYAGCATPDRSLLVSAVALAEKFNADADLVLSGVAPGVIAAEHRARFAAYHRYFSEAKKHFARSLTLRCLAANDNECTPIYITYKDGVFRYCPARSNGASSVLAAIQMLQALYETIAGGPGNLSAWEARNLAPVLSVGRTPPLPVQDAPAAPVAPPVRPAATRKEVKRGHRGCPVPELQEKLGITGNPVTVTGVFDAATEQAVKAFQQTRGLSESSGAKSGVADAATWASLHAAAPGNHGLPTGETFISRGWSTGGDSTIHKWDQRLLPATVDFSGCKVKEEEPGGGVNSCCTPGTIGCMKAVTGGDWLVGGEPPQAARRSMYGPDFVGLTKPAVDAARSRRFAPCAYTIPQRMVVMRPEGNVEYVRNKLIYNVDKDQVTCAKSNSNDTQSVTKKA